MTETPNRQRSTGSLLSDAMNHLGNLVRDEIDLARTEMSDNVTRAAVAVGLLVGAVVVALVALIVLSFALVDAIVALGLDPGWAALIVGVAYAVIAFAMVSKGVNDLKASSLAPTRTVRNVRRDARAVKETLE